MKMAKMLKVVNMPIIWPLAMIGVVAFGAMVINARKKKT